MRSLFFLLLCAVEFTVFFGVEAMAQKSRKSVSAAEVTGTFEMRFKGKYRSMANVIKIQSLGGGKLRVAMDLAYPYTTPAGELSANTGSLDGKATIEGDTAMAETGGDFGIHTCAIIITFVKPGTIKVTQEGDDSDCDFGHNVRADGTYTKISSKKPKFEQR